MAFLKIFGDWKGAREALNGVAKHAKKVNAQIKSSFSGLNSFFSKVFSPLGFGLGGLGITTVFTQIVNKLDAIGKSSANMGVSAEYFQKMNFAAERTGTSIDQVREAFAKVQALVGKFMTGDKNAAGIMGQLGLTREDLAGLNAEQTFDKVNRALRGIGDEQTRNAVAAKLYGETFQKLNNFLRDYVDLGEEAQSRGLIVSDETIKAAEDLKDAMTNAGTAFAVAFANSGILEKLQEVTKEMDDAAARTAALNKSGAKVQDNRPWWQKAIGGTINRSGIGTVLNLVGKLKYGSDYNLGRELTYKWFGNTETYSNNFDAYAVMESRKQLNNAIASGLGPASPNAPQETQEKEINKFVEERIKKYERELKYQQLILQGKAKEAALERELDQARAESERRGSPFTAEDEAKIRASFSALYALQHPEQAAASAAASGAAALSSRIAEYPTDALRRIGGYSGAFNSSNPSLNYQRKSTDFLDKINQRVSSIEQNLQTSGTSGATFP